LAHAERAATTRGADTFLRGRWLKFFSANVAELRLAPVRPAGHITAARSTPRTPIALAPLAAMPSGYATGTASSAQIIVVTHHIPETNNFQIN